VVLDQIAAISGVDSSILKESLREEGFEQFRLVIEPFLRIHGCELY
jgi:hypothetical protein